MLNKILIIIIVSLLLITSLLFVNKCGNKHLEYDTIITSIVYVDSIKYEPEPIYSYVVVDSIRLKDSIIFDTLRIIEEFYTKNAYTDTILDTLGVFVSITDTVYKNKIEYRYKNISIVKHDTTLKPLYIKPYFSAGLLYNNGIIPTVLYTNKKITYTYGYNLKEKNSIFGIIFKLN